jgi:hypothetical protein
MSATAPSTGAATAISAMLTELSTPIIPLPGIVMPST